LSNNIIELKQKYFIHQRLYLLVFEMKETYEAENPIGDIEVSKLSDLNKTVIEFFVEVIFGG